MKINASNRKWKEKEQLVDDAITKVKEPLQPITNVFASSKFQENVQAKVLESVSTLQRNVQSFLLPASLQVKRPSHEEIMKNRVVMDRKWYSWNIFISLLPGLFLICLFEYNKPGMKAYYKRVNANMREENLAGVDVDTDTPATNSVTNSNDSDNNLLLTLLSVDEGKGIAERVTEAVNIIFGLQPPPSHDDGEIIDSTTTVVSSSSSNASESLTTNDHEKNQASIDLKRKPNEEQHDIGTTETQTINDLLARIKALEDKLHIPETSPPVTITPSSKPIHNRSNIQKRVMARKQKEQLPGEDKKEIINDQNNNDSIFSSTEILQQMSLEKVKDITKSIQSIFFGGGELESKQRDDDGGGGEDGELLNNKHDHVGNVQQQTQSFAEINNNDETKSIPINQHSIDKEVRKQPQNATRLEDDDDSNVTSYDDDTLKSIDKICQKSMHEQQHDNDETTKRRSIFKWLRFV